MNIYFVCTGNTCRSPMAEAILADKNLANIAVRSAGIYAYDGGTMSDLAKQTLDAEDINHNHTSQAVTSENMYWADIILTMTTSHRDTLKQLFPEAVNKIKTLKEYVGEQSLNVGDPFGGNAAIYRATYEELQSLITKLAVQIAGDK